MLTRTNAVADKVIDTIRYLASFTATGTISDIGLARECVRMIADHKLCEFGIVTVPKELADKDCSSGCLELSEPLWELTIYVQRYLTIYQDEDEE